ncbi:MAG: serine/threonine-protein kinase, partial [Pseudomonadota bacterium]
MNPLCEGTSIDHFKVLRHLAQGGMGEVYLARDTLLGRRVALKMIRQKERSEAALGRFLDESRLTASLNHPNIVAVYTAGSYQGNPYLALEYVEGQNLRQRMREDRPGAWESIRILLSVANALVEAHRQGILHRDLKPENVVIGKDGRVRVLDFGIAKLQSSS